MPIDGHEFDGTDIPRPGTQEDAEFFPDGRFKSNFLCCLGHGDATNLEPRGDRFAFDEVCKVL